MFLYFRCEEREASPTRRNNTMAARKTTLLCVLLDTLDIVNTITTRVSIMSL